MMGDLGVLVEPSAEDAQRVMEALTAFGFGEVGLSAANVQEPEGVAHIG